MKSDNFNTEIARINDNIIKEDTKYLLNNLPDYFFQIAASSTGKYHPSFSLGEKGLIRHVKVAEKIAEELFNDSVFSKNFTEHDKDLIRMAIILHDGLKKGKLESDYTCFNHPLLMANFIKEQSGNLKSSEADIETVARLIRSHMGPWNIDRFGNSLPVPEKEDEKFVHLCDYLASRNFLNVSFDENEIIDSARR